MTLDPMRPRATPMGPSIAVALLGALAIVAIAALGPWPTVRLGLALRATARWSYLWFWLAYSGAAMAKLFGPRFLQLARGGRAYGLSFAAAHGVHLALVAWYLHVATRPYPRMPLAFFGIGVAWLFVLVLLSFQLPSSLVGVKATRTLRLVGIEYIAFAFWLDFWKSPFAGSVGHRIFYQPFVVLAGCGLLLRVAAASRGVRFLSITHK